MKFLPVMNRVRHGKLLISVPFSDLKVLKRMAPRMHEIYPQHAEAKFG